MTTYAEPIEGTTERVIGEMNGKPVVYRRSIYWDGGATMGRWCVSDTVHCWKDGRKTIYPTTMACRAYSVPADMPLSLLEVHGMMPIDEIDAKAIAHIMAHISKPRETK